MSAAAERGPDEARRGAIPKSGLGAWTAEKSALYTAEAPSECGWSSATEREHHPAQECSKAGLYCSPEEWARHLARRSQPNHQERPAAPRQARVDMGVMPVLSPAEPAQEEVMAEAEPGAMWTQNKGLRVAATQKLEEVPRGTRS